MSVGTADIMEALLPASNGPIARAMQELESKLTAWTRAVSTVNDRLAQREAALSSPTEGAKQDADDPVSAPSDREMTGPAQAVESAPVHPTGAVQKSTPVSIESDPAAEARDAGGSPGIAEPALREATGGEAAEVHEPETPELIEAMLAKLNPETAEAVRARYEFFKGRKPFRELIQEFEDEADDEESLLMSLDPEVAKAVRVKFRLYNGRKTLREVIAEVEAQPAKAPQVPEKKTWWGKRR